MGVYTNINQSYDAGIAPSLLESYLQRRALENVEPNLNYLSDAQMIEQPKNNGKHVTFFRYSELPAVDKPLYEGVTPDGQKLTETAFSVMTKNYGGYMAYTDEIDLWHVDNKTQAMSDRLNRQAQLTLDTVGRDQIMSGLNVMYPGNITDRSQIKSTDILTYAIIKKVVRNLKKKGAQPFEDGYFHGKIDHDTYYDLTNDPHWETVSTTSASALYRNDEKTEKYLLGAIYKVKFYEVDNGKVYKGESYLDADHTLASLTAYSDFNATERSMVVTAAITPDLARELTGKMVYVQYTDTNDYVTPMCIEKVYPGTSNTAKVIFRWAPAVTTKWTTSYSLCIVPQGAGYSGAEVHASIIYGKNAYGMVKLGGKGKPNIQIIVKPLGSSGSDDPLNQRGTIGWKVPFFACAVLQDDFICRIEHGVSA